MKVLYIFFLLSICASAQAQDYDGQWRGSFTETSYSFAGFGDNKIDYVLELQTSGTHVTGYSYTYFYEGTRKYYTICKLAGTLNRQTKELVVTETDRVKYNTPPDFQNCFQTHRLQYYRDSGDIEVLKGTWIPAPNQSGNCGYGTTFLSRKIVKPLVVTPHLAPKRITPTSLHKTTHILPRKEPRHELATTRKKPAVHRTLPPEKRSIKQKAPSPPKSEVALQIPTPGPSLRGEKQAVIAPPVDQEAKPRVPAGFENRRKDILKTIEITSHTFRVDFYDNGIIDGDSITVFFNGKIILLHRMLSDKAITLNLSLDPNLKENVLTMYADNLGTIPPNTALMVVTDGDKRYEVRIASDTEKSGSVIFESAKPEDRSNSTSN